MVLGEGAIFQLLRKFKALQSKNKSEEINQKRETEVLYVGLGAAVVPASSKTTNNFAVVDFDVRKMR